MFCNVEISLSRKRNSNITGHAKPVNELGGARLQSNTIQSLLEYVLPALIFGYRIDNKRLIGVKCYVMKQLGLL